MIQSHFIQKLVIASVVGCSTLVFSVGSQAQAAIFGLKSCGSGSPGVCSSGNVPNSLPPAHLFSFEEDGSQFTDIGAVNIGGTEIDADGLALSSTHGLLGFELVKSGFSTVGSTLISINPNTAVATPIGSNLNGRDIRGAVFDQFDNLWALDAQNDEVLQIDPATGSVVNTPISLTLSGNLFNLSSVSDIAVKADVTFFIVDFTNSSGSSIYTLNTGNGSLTLVHTDSTVGLDGNITGAAGAAFSSETPPDALFTYDAVFDEDIFRYDIDSGFSRTLLYSDVINSFNAGRGDLASITPTEPVPEPLTILGSATALGFGALLKRESSKKKNKS